jgi:hypothetical protein
MEWFIIKFWLNSNFKSHVKECDNKNVEVKICVTLLKPKTLSQFSLARGRTWAAGMSLVHASQDPALKMLFQPRGIGWSYFRCKEYDLLYFIKWNGYYLFQMKYQNLKFMHFIVYMKSILTHTSNLIPLHRKKTPASRAIQVVTVSSHWL